MGEVKERPILFSGPMVIPLLADLKTNTRRIINPQPQAPGVLTTGDGQWRVLDRKGMTHVFGWEHDCPYGKTGDRLWVRESHTFQDIEPMVGGQYNMDVMYHADQKRRTLYEADCAIEVDFTQFRKSEFKGRPSIFMPRWASRITLEITDVRVQRLQDISEEDCIAEGARWQWEGLWWTPGSTALTDERNPAFHNSPKLNGPRGAFGMLWEAINGVGSWNENPWVWALSFRRV